MEPDCPLPYSFEQFISTLTNMNPGHSPRPYFLQIHLNMTFLSIAKSFEWSLSFISPPPQISMHFSSPPYVPHSYISSSVISSHSWYMSWSIINKTSHYAIPSIILWHPQSYSKRIPQYPVVENRRSMFVLQCDRPCSHTCNLMYPIALS
jgi:hypothetical protein